MPRCWRHRPACRAPGTGESPTPGGLAIRRPAASFSAEDGLAFLVEGFDAFPEVIRGAQPTVAMPLELDGRRQEGVLGVVQKFLRRALGKRRKFDQFLDQCLRGLLEV